LAEDSICGRAYGGKFATPYIKGTERIVLCGELNIEGTYVTFCMKNFGILDELGTLQPEEFQRRC
jgi:hypothetical protein